jgi:hypothetical protein
MRIPPRFAGMVVTSIVALQASPLAARQQQPPPGGLGENAALRYWQAFAHVPALDDAQKKLLEGPAGAGAPDAEAVKVAEAGRDALIYLRRGAAIGPADWGLHREDGPNLLLPHLGRGRDLARLAALQARVDFARGDAAAAVDGAADAIVLGRHLGADVPTLITYLVQLACERIGIESVAPHLAGLDGAALDRLEKRLAALPPGGSLEACLTVERDSFLDWAVTRLRAMADAQPWKETVLRPLSGSPEEQDKIVAASGGTRQGVLKNLEALRPVYEEVRGLLPLPQREFHAEAAELRRRTEPNAIARAVLPAFGKVYDRDAAGRTRMTLLRAAVAAARGGAGRVDEFKDTNGTPLTYRETAEGFELVSTVVDEGKPVVLVVGGKTGK